jgi:putative DNA primase/helicase
MRQDFFEYRPVFKLVIAGNHKPSLRSVDEAIRRRFHLVPFVVTVPEAERDPQLTETLKTEWPGILAWMTAGALEWQAAGLQPPQAVRDATEAYLAAEDAIAAWMAECCDRNPNAWEASRNLFGSWSAWANTAGEATGSQRSFSQALEARGLIRKNTEHAKGFLGLKIRAEMNAQTW